jgi:hypothetical protein
LTITAGILDSGAESSVMYEDTAKKLKLVDTNEKYDLSGASTKTTESIGMIPEVPVILGPGCVLYEKIVVIKYKPLLAFSNALLKRYKCKLDWDKDKLKISPNGKKFTIPVTMHRVKNNVEVNYAVTKTNEPLQSNPDGEDFLKKYDELKDLYDKDILKAVEIIDTLSTTLQEKPTHGI